MLKGNDTGPDGIEMDVINDAAQGIIVLDQERLVTALEKMTALVSEAVETAGEGTLQPVHAFNQIRTGRFKRQVKVIAHDGPRMQDPAVDLACFNKALLERFRCSVRPEQVFAIVAPIDHMVPGTAKLDSQFSRHESTHETVHLSCPHSNVTMFGLTPSACAPSARPRAYGWLVGGCFFMPFDILSVFGNSAYILENS